MPYRLGHTDFPIRERWIGGEAHRTRGRGLERLRRPVVDSELLLGYKGSEESGLLRDPALRAWRDEHRDEIKELLEQLHREAAALPPEPVTEGERILLRAFDMDGDLDDA